MSRFNRIQVQGDPECPVSIDSFMTAGRSGQNNTAIVSYDEFYNLVFNTAKAMQPFVTEGVPNDLADDALVTIRVKAGDLRFISKQFKPKTQ